MKYTIRDIREGDLEIIAPQLRECDKRELEAATGQPILETLIDSVKECCAPGFTKIVELEDGTLAILFGCNPSGIPCVGVPWMVATDAFFDVVGEFKNECMEWIERMNDAFPMLINYVDERNRASIRWLKLCGFQFTKLDPEWGHAKIPFWEFVRFKNV